VAAAEATASVTTPATAVPRFVVGINNGSIYHSERDVMVSIVNNFGRPV